MVTHRLRWIAGAALAAALLVAGGLPHWQGDVTKNRTQILREAFDQASSHCYATYQGRELQGCLVGAMQAHLQALGGHGPDEPSGPIGAVSTRRGDI